MTSTDSPISGGLRGQSAPDSYPGMVKQENWRDTLAARHTASYGCARCGAKFRTPAAAYNHIDNACKRRKRRK